MNDRSPLRDRVIRELAVATERERISAAAHRRAVSITEDVDVLTMDDLREILKGTP